MEHIIDIKTIFIIAHIFLKIDELIGINLALLLNAIDRQQNTMYTLYYKKIMSKRILYEIFTRSAAMVFVGC